MRGAIRSVCLAALLLAGAAFAGDAAEDQPEAEEVEIVEDFDAWTERWTPLQADRWRVAEGQGDDPAALELIKPGRQRGGVRRPGSYALLANYRWRSFTLELEVRSLEPDRKRGRDVCLIFGHRDDTRFHYAHLSDDADGNAHNVIMTVAGDKRFTIHKPAKPEPRLTRDWRKARLTLDADGNVALYLVDMDKPLMTATIAPDRTGRIALGAFNDRAAFRNVRITGRAIPTDR